MRAPWAERGREGEGASQGLWPVLVRIRCLKIQIVLLTSIVSFLFLTTGRLSCGPIETSTMESPLAELTKKPTASTVSENLMLI